MSKSKKNLTLNCKPIGTRMCDDSSLMREMSLCILSQVIFTSTSSTAPSYNETMTVTGAIESTGGKYLYSRFILLITFIYGCGVKCVKHNERSRD